MWMWLGKIVCCCCCCVTHLLTYICRMSSTPIATRSSSRWCIIVTVTRRLSAIRLLPCIMIVVVGVGLVHYNSILRMNNDNVSLTKRIVISATVDALMLKPSLVLVSSKSSGRCLITNHHCNQCSHSHRFANKVTVPQQRQQQQQQLLVRGISTNSCSSSRSRSLSRIICSSSESNVDAIPTTDTTMKKATGSTTKDGHPFYELTNEQRDFVIGYMNKHHTMTFHIPAITTFSLIGKEMAKANTWSGGSFTIVNATLTNISMERMDLEYNVTIQRRSQSVPEYRHVSIPMTTGGRSSFVTLIPTTPIDDLVRSLCQMCFIMNNRNNNNNNNNLDRMAMTGKFIQLAIQLNGIGIGKLPENMYLNQVPHNVYVRQWFYDQAAIAVHDAVKLSSPQNNKVMMSNRQKVVTLFPETNPSMDSYRIGTLLELIRTVTLRLVNEERLRVRICVQSSMGVGIFTGVPKQLSGVMKLLQLMDWQNDVGEVNEGIIGDYVRFGAIGPEHVMNTTRDTYNDSVVTQYQDDVYLIIAPQSMVGTDTSIIPLLSDMCTAIGTERPIILFNPDLTDKISSGGQQSVRGRQTRIDFANTFQTIFHFQNIYVSGTSYFPILGTITKLHPEEPWIAHQRRDYANNNGEVYVPVLAGESIPDGEMILAAFER